MAFGHFLLGSHNFIVTTLGSCVKWPLRYCVFNGHFFVICDDSQIGF